MNKTEQHAYQWLLAHGAKEIKFQKRSSPDFLTDIGNVEVKKQTSKKILVTPNQVRLLNEDQSIFYLVYPKGRETPELLTTKEFLGKYEIQDCSKSSCKTHLLYLDKDKIQFETEMPHNYRVVIPKNIVHDFPKKCRVIITIEPIEGKKHDS